MPTADSIQNDTTPESDRPSHRLVPVACAVVLVAVCLWVVATVVHCIAVRLDYPYELSWMEGCFVDHARRAAVGKPIYAAPSAEFIGLLYTPVGHFAAAGLIRLGLDGFLATRLVSLFSLVAAGLLGMSMAARAAPHPWVCVLVPVLILAGYFDVDAYMDVGRSDSLLALFCLAAVAVLSLRSARLAVHAAQTGTSVGRAPHADSAVEPSGRAFAVLSIGASAAGLVRSTSTFPRSATGRSGSDCAVS